MDATELRLAGIQITVLGGILLNVAAFTLGAVGIAFILFGTVLVGYGIREN